MPETEIQHTFISEQAAAVPVTFVQSSVSSVAVVILPSAFGAASDVLEQMRELARAAGLVAAYEPFFRQDPGVVPYTDVPRVMRRVAELDREQTWLDVCQLIEWVRSQPGICKVVIVGVCFGGPFALRAVAEHVADAAVTWHGSRLEAVAELAKSITAPIHLHFGALDPIVPQSTITTMRHALSANPAARIFVHDDATHGFSHRHAPHAYNAPAEAAAMHSVFSLIAECKETSAEADTKRIDLER